MLGCALATSVGAIGLFNYALAALFPYWVQQLGVTREVLGRGNLAYSLAVLAFAPLAAVLIDRLGVLRVAAAGFTAQTLVFMAIALVPAAGAAGWLIGLSGLMAAVALGTSPLGFARLVTANFAQARGFALALMTGAQGVAAVLTPLLLSWATPRFGWRVALAALALASAAVGAAACVLIARELRRRGHAVVAARSPGDHDWSALRRPLSWLLLVAFFLAPLSATGWLLQFAQIAHEKGAPLTQATGGLALIGAAMLAGRLAAGPMLDRAPTGLVLMGYFLLAALGCALLPALPLRWLWLAPLLIATIIGGEQDFLPFVTARYFTPQSAGRLYGCLYGAFIFGGGMSVLALLTVGRLGMSQQAVGWVSAGALTLAGVALGVALSLAGPAGASHRAQGSHPQ